MFACRVYHRNRRLLRELLRRDRGDQPGRCVRPPLQIDGVNICTGFSFSYRRPLLFSALRLYITPHVQRHLRVSCTHVPSRRNSPSIVLGRNATRVSIFHRPRHESRESRKTSTRVIAARDSRYRCSQRCQPSRDLRGTTGYRTSRDLNDRRSRRESIRPSTFRSNLQSSSISRVKCSGPGFLNGFYTLIFSRFIYVNLYKRYNDIGSFRSSKYFVSNNDIVSSLLIYVNLNRFAR